MSPRLVESDEGLVSITAHDQMLNAAAEQLACPDLGLRLAERQDLSILGPLAVVRAVRSGPRCLRARRSPRDEGGSPGPPSFSAVRQRRCPAASRW
ncbi:AraC family transcriptional regulator [Streptomyces sp. ARC32]